MEQYREAKQVYFQYDGSRLAMDRDGPISENVASFDSYGVPDEVLRAWDEELIAGHLDLLDQPANWHVISFLMSRGFGAYLIQLTAQAPLGRLRDKVIYLECLLRYADSCSDDRTVLRYRDAHYEPQHLWHALDQVLLWARPLLRTARGAGVLRATRRLGAFEDSTGRRIARATDPTRRLRRVIDRAQQRLGVCEDPTGRRVALWRWDPDRTANAGPGSQSSAVRHTVVQAALEADLDQRDTRTSGSEPTTLSGARPSLPCQPASPRWHRPARLVGAPGRW